MGVYIKGMEMPIKKNGAVLIIYPDGKCAFEDGKTYQAVPVPPHGRLIDADALLFECNSGRIRPGESFVTRTYVNDAPTIIEAEEVE